MASLRIAVLPPSGEVWTTQVDEDHLLPTLRAHDDGFVAVLCEHAELTPTAAVTIAAVLADDPTIDVVYTDEQACGTPGTAGSVFLRPGWSPERQEVQDYIGSAWFRIELVCKSLDESGGPIEYALHTALAHARRIAHIPQVLMTGTTGIHRPVESKQNTAIATPSVSIVIPTGGSRRLVVGENQVLVDLAVRSLGEQTDYENFELIVVGDRNIDDELLQQLQTNSEIHVRTIRNQRPFNFSEACNLGAEASEADVLVFLNDDTRCLDPNWLHRMINYAVRPQVGAVGTHLLYEDGRIQHAGIWARNGIPGHRYPGFAPDFPGLRNSLLGPQNCVAVTGACLMVERAKFESVDGFDSSFPLNFNDVDLCLRLLQNGYRTVLDHGHSFVHFESATRNPSGTPEEYALLDERWGHELARDFWDHPNHVAPSPNEYPPPHPAFAEAMQLPPRASHAPRVWDCLTGRPLDFFEEENDGG